MNPLELGHLPIAMSHYTFNINRLNVTPNSIHFQCVVSVSYVWLASMKDNLKGGPGSVGDCDCHVYTLFSMHIQWKSISIPADVGGRRVLHLAD